jgi:hypothetical protein
MRRFADADGRKLLDSLISDMRLTGINHHGRIEEWFTSLGEKKGPSTLPDKEKELSLRIPKVAGSVGDHMRAKQRAETPKGLHGLMAWEALNLVDGQRSILDIHRAVHAQAMSGGEWYYGKVSLEDIEALFANAEKEKAVEIGSVAPPPSTARTGRDE